ncbi:golgin IMH1-like [Nylanderia fulva]|uniref:golgin IMH1-like n=1 Tax=Nylanderia fulva TaxID=613905 RepID=UPI0010FB4DF1|nr:golgin IMH1-like [Nylanderia fulva]XP_029175607.1 golgin IMH1-like [Nylanderia fulva]
MNILENKIAFTNNNTKNTTSNSLLIAYENKRVELKMIKDTISMYQNSFLEKEKVLKEEQQKLEKLNSQVSLVEDLFCEQVWQFSHEHNLSGIFKYYPFFNMETDCTKQIRNYDKDDVEKSSEVTDLINKIDTIRAEIISFNRDEKNIKQEVESALMDLWKLQLIANDITELLRLINPSESSCEPATSILIYDEIIPYGVNKIRRLMSDSDRQNSMNKKTCNNQKELLKDVKNKLCLKKDTNFRSTKKVTIRRQASFKNYPELSLQKSIVLTARTPAMTNVSKESTCSEKFDNFTLKKRSEISIKFEQHRQHM